MKKSIPTFSDEHIIFTAMKPDIYKADGLRYEKEAELYRRCGNSGILLPSVSLGLWKNFGGTSPYEDSKGILHYAFDHGITHFDLANNYGPPYGSAEETLGKVMADSFAPYRDEMFIATKAGYDMWPGPYGNWGSRKYLTTSLNQSLKRMKLDYVDLFYSHRYDPSTPLEETLQTLVDIVRAGKALYVGISRWPLEAAKFAVKYLSDRDVPLLCYQGKLNMLDREPLEEGILDLVDETGCGFVSFSPLAQGILAGRYLDGIPADSRIRKDSSLTDSALTPELTAKLKQLSTLAQERSESLAQLALRWVLDQKGVTSVIVGVSSVKQLADNLGTAFNQPLTDSEKHAIDRILK